jgi:hypothetical protein
MKIEFYYDSHREWYAISLNEIYNGFLCEEIHWATVISKHKKYWLRYEDSFGTGTPFDTLEDAKAHVLVNYERHTPLINGKSVEVDLGDSQTLEV